MKKFLLSLCLFSAISFAAPGPGGNLGVGLIVGDPTGLSVKYWTGASTAWDFAFGSAGNWRSGRYYDPKCDGGRYYRDNQNYCNERLYDGGYGNGWDAYHLHADYLFHNFSAIKASERFPLHYGPGLAINMFGGDYTEFGIRGNFGVSWLPRGAPLDVFLELAPTMYLFPEPFFDMDGGLGVRFYF